LGRQEVLAAYRAGIFPPTFPLCKPMMSMFTQPE
jgi:hypothetical protein